VATFPDPLAPSCGTVEIRGIDVRREVRGHRRPGWGRHDLEAASYSKPVSPRWI